MSFYSPAYVPQVLPILSSMTFSPNNIRRVVRIAQLFNHATFSNLILIHSTYTQISSSATEITPTEGLMTFHSILLTFIVYRKVKESNLIKGIDRP
jgi:hypothetical protein